MWRLHPGCQCRCSRVKKTVGSTNFYYHFAHYEIGGDEGGEHLNHSAQRDTGKVVAAPKGHPRFTGQKEDASGLQYYASRYCDPSIGMFVSSDTMVPDAGNVFAHDRYMYVLGNPLHFVDPTGHYSAQQVAKHFGLEEWDTDKIAAILKEQGLNAAWLAVLLTAQDGDQINAWNAVLHSEAGGTFQLNATFGILAWFWCEFYSWQPLFS